MEKCFDLSLCRRHGFSIYVYPKQEDINGKISKLFADVIDSIRRSHYITQDPEKACIKGNVALSVLVSFCRLVGMKLLRFFGDISFYRTNSNRTYRVDLQLRSNFFQHTAIFSIFRTVIGFKKRTSPFSYSWVKTVENI